MNIIHINPGILPIPPNGWGAIEKIIWEYKLSLEKKNHKCDILYVNDIIHPNCMQKGTIVHVHVANLALMLHKNNIPYYFTCHDHHAYLYGKNSQCFIDNYNAILHSVKSFVPSKYLVEYFNLPNLKYVSHGVNSNFFNTSVREMIPNHKLLCVANNGFSHDSSEDRKGFSLAIQAAKILNLPLTIAGPKNNKNFFDKYKFEYDKLTVLYDLSEDQLLNVYQTHSIFLHPSILEAGHPNLTLLEAMSCGLPVIGTFEDNNELSGLYKIKRNVGELTDGIRHVLTNYQTYQQKCLETSKNLSWDNITDQLLSKYMENNMGQQLINAYNTTKINHKDPYQLENKLSINFNNSCKVEIQGKLKKKYEVSFIDNKTNALIFTTNIINNNWAATNIKYFVEWKINIKELDTNAEMEYVLDLKDKHVKIINESPSLGDFISWMPIVDLFQKKHGCILHFYTPRKELFQSEYNNITFYNYNYGTDINYHATYRLGCHNINDRNLSPVDYRTQNLQQIACGILGIESKEIKPIVIIKDKTKPDIKGAYICISTASTSGCKHWQNKEGWQKTVDYLNSLNYKVVVLQKEELNYMDLQGLNNVIHPKTDKLDDVIQWLYNCEFYIGLSSGISWLAWALNKKVVMISGFTEEFNEFYTPYRIINKSVCNGCWNDNSLEKLNAGDWNWCPKHKGTNRQFECSKEITFEMVKEKINLIINPNITDDELFNKEFRKLLNEKLNTNTNRKNFESTIYREIFEWNQYEKFVTVDYNDFVVDLGCSKGYFYIKHKDKNIKYVGIDGSIDCINDFIENLEENDTTPILLHTLIDKTKTVKSFPSMFHNNKLNNVMSMTFPDLLRLINRRIDFLKFDIEGYESNFLDENYDLFKQSVNKFSGEFHFTGNHFLREKGYEVLKKLVNDNNIVIKLFSIDGVDITNSFFLDSNYYTEIIISGKIK